MCNKFRIATYNVEWFTELFGSNDNLVSDDTPSKHHGATKKQQADAIAGVIESVDADLYCIVEAPQTNKDLSRSTVKALEAFANNYSLRTKKAMIGFNADQNQEIALLYDPDRINARHDPQGTQLQNTAGLRDFLKGQKVSPAPRFDSFYILDVEDDDVNEVYYFTRPPLEAEVELKDGNVLATIRLIGVHTKSKGVFEPYDEIQTANKALSNRRNILAQCQWIRDRVDELLSSNKDIIVLGDFNDGPGLDFYERQFGRSAVELVMGDIGTPDMLLRNPYTRVKWGEYGWKPASAQFYQPETSKTVNALLDFVLLSPGLKDRANAQWRIWHPYDDNQIKNNAALKDALLKASDHFPVSVDMTF